MVPLSAEGGEGWRRSRQKLRFRVLRTRPKGFAIALWKPSLPAYKLVSYPALVGRGGSVSRRDHNRAYRRRTALAWVRKPEETHKPIPSHSSGEGVWGRGASLREAASPPASPPKHNLFGREREGGGFSQRSLLPRINSFNISPHSLDLGAGRQRVTAERAGSPGRS